MGNKEIENLLEDNYKKLCEKSEELKEAISQKVDYEKNFISAKEKLSQLNYLSEKIDGFWRSAKRKFFFKNTKDFIYLNYLSKKYKKKVIEEIYDAHLNVMSANERKGGFSNVSKKLSEVSNEMKKLFSEKFFTYDELAGEVSGIKDGLLFEAMLETGLQLSKSMEV